MDAYGYPGQWPIWDDCFQRAYFIHLNVPTLATLPVIPLTSLLPGCALSVAPLVFCPLQCHIPPASLSFTLPNAPVYLFLRSGSLSCPQAQSLLSSKTTFQVFTLGTSLVQQFELHTWKGNCHKVCASSAAPTPLLKGAASQAPAAQAWHLGPIWSSTCPLRSTLQGFWLPPWEYSSCTCTSPAPLGLMPEILIVGLPTFLQLPSPYRGIHL